MHVSFNEVIEFVGKGKIQDLMDSFYQVTGVANAVVDIAGNIVVQTGWQDLCAKFHSKTLCKRQISQNPYPIRVLPS